MSIILRRHRFGTKSCVSRMWSGYVCVGPLGGLIGYSSHHFSSSWLVRPRGRLNTTADAEL